jgi:hypothetical protein
MSRFRFGILAVLSCISVASGQSEAVLQPYEVDEAYRVYEAILPSKGWFATGRLVIQLETGPLHNSTYGCLSDEPARKFKAAAADFATVNEKSGALQSKFKLEMPYELVSSDSLHRADFDKQHPGSGGFITVSGVGFNKRKTLAVVFVESSCGGLCGSFTFHLLEKIRGKWKEANGVSCAGAS